MTLRRWRRLMAAVGIGLLLVGAVLMIGGGLYAGRQQYDPDAGGNVMLGIWVGTFGTLGVVTGVVLLKLGLMGPYPRHLRSQAPPEASD